MQGVADLRRLFAMLVGIAMIMTAAPVQAASYTWGYNYGRTRTTQASIAGLAMGNADAAGEQTLSVPYLISMPGRSQSTPVVVGKQWYLMTDWAGGTRGELWTGTLLPGGKGSAASEVLGLNAKGPERFNQPADAAISPDGKWVAFAAGKRLWWWPAGDPAARVVQGIPGPAPIEAVSSSPTFVPDPGVPSGWAVCSGDWDGADYCFGVMTQAELVANGGRDNPRWYLSTQNSSGAAVFPASPITSSGAYSAATGDIYFGVASNSDPRLVAMNPLTGALDATMGLGSVRAPVWAATAVRGGSVYASDLYGDMYRFDAASGTLLDWTGAANCGQVNIQSPTVTANSVYVIGCGYSRLYGLDRHTLASTWSYSFSSGPSMGSDITAVTQDGPTQLVFASTIGGIEEITPPESVPTWYTEGPANNNPFGSAVVEGSDVLLWSDGAGSYWRGAGAAASALQNAFPGTGQDTGTLEIFHVQPQESVFISPTKVVIGQTPTTPIRVYALATPGAVVHISGQSSWPNAKVTTLSVNPGGAACAAGNNYGIFGLCGPWSTQQNALQAFATKYGALAHYNHPAWVGPLPATWASRSALYLQWINSYPNVSAANKQLVTDAVGFDAWEADLAMPQTAGWYAATLVATMPNGSSVEGTAWMNAVCPAGDVESSAGACSVPPPPPPPSNGICNTTCYVPGGLARCHNTYSSVPGCLPPACGAAGYPTCNEADHLWRECNRREDHCVWPILVGPVRGKWGVASPSNTNQ